MLSEEADDSVEELMIIDPHGSKAWLWKKSFLSACIVSLFIDPLFLMVPQTRPEICMENGVTLQMILTIMRSVGDAFYLVNMALQFRMAYVEPSSRVLGRGELVVDPNKIATRYLRFRFWVDLIAALPVPQVFFWAVMPKIGGANDYEVKTSLRFIVMIQFVYRLVLVYPLSLQIAKETGIIWETAWVGAAYNLLFVILSSDVAASSWYLLGLQRLESCWGSVCNGNSTVCHIGFLRCSTSTIADPVRNAWIQSSNVTTLCQPSSTYYQFGIYGEAVNNAASSSPFYSKLCYSLWWGLKTLCSLGQNLTTSIYIGENVFAVLLSTLALINYTLLVGYIQSYLQSATARLEEWRLKRNDREQWMHLRQLPPDLRKSIRKYDRHKWVATQGVDEESLLKRLPPDLQRQIKRHLCLDLVKRVPLFNRMDDRMLDSICERLKATLCTQGTVLISEGDPVSEMHFIVQGWLHSYTTGGGSREPGFFNSTRIGFGDFCGEELLTWVLDPPSNGALPSSTCTVKAVTDVDAFVLEAEDLQFIARQFRRRLGSREIKHAFRFYSLHWRTWAACYIQAAWRRHKNRKLLRELVARESAGSQLNLNLNHEEELDVFVPQPGSGLAVYAARLMAIIKRGSSNRFGPDSYVT
ncbi:hypothetical protein Dimus_009839 [Dionaea muscipula]